MKRKLIVITCPKCGREYLPAEIYIPDNFFGRPEYIKRDIDGSIIDYAGTSLDTEESYICDNCKSTFKIAAKITFDTVIDNKSDFDTEYTTKLKPRFTLKEF